MSMYLSPSQLGQDDAAYQAASEAPVQPVTPAPFDVEQAASQISAQASSWWQSQQEYKRQAIISGAMTGVVLYWMSRILGRVFGK